MKELLFFLIIFLSALLGYEFGEALRATVRKKRFSKLISTAIEATQKERFAEAGDLFLQSLSLQRCDWAEYLLFLSLIYNDDLERIHAMMWRFNSSHRFSWKVDLWLRRYESTGKLPPKEELSPLKTQKETKFLKGRKKIFYPALSSPANKQ